MEALVVESERAQQQSGSALALRDPGQSESEGGRLGSVLAGSVLTSRGPQHSSASRGQR